MKTRLVRIVIVLLAGVSLASAQSPKWSPQQQEVIDHIKECWNAWMDAAQKGDAEVWIARCPVASGATMWWTDGGAPSDPVAWIRRNFDMIRDEKPKWTDLVPVSVAIFDDVAIVHFYGYWQITRGGSREVVEHKRTEVFKKVRGKWTFLGGQVTPVEKPAAR